MHLNSIVRRFGALFAAAAGLMNIISALYPSVPSRMELLRDLLPMHFIRASQTATVLVGFCLILLADGLRKRRQRAMQLTVGLLAVSVVLNLTKGLDFEEAMASVLVAVTLLAGRGAFTVRCRVPVPRHMLPQILGLAVLYYCYLLAGFVVLRHAVYPRPTVASVTREPFHLLFDVSYFHYLTPQAQWFGRSIIILGSLGAFYALAQLLRPLIPTRAATPSELDRARALVRRYGSDTLSYFALQDGRSYFFDQSGEAFLSYRLWGTVALVGGDPIGRPDRIAPLIAAFAEFAGDHGIDPCFLGVTAAHEAAYRHAGYRLLKIGEEALIDLPSFDVASLKRKVRRAVRHAGEMGIEAICYRAGEVPAEVYAQLQEISRRWVESKGGEQGFSMTLGRLPRAADADCELIVAMHGGYVLGYLSLVPAYESGTWSLDAMRRRAESPNGLTEFLVAHAAESYRERGYQTLSLNFATLSNAEDNMDSRALDGARQFLWEHLSAFYQLKSLYQFNSKFQPRWRSRYLAYRDVLKIPKLAIAIAQSEAPVQLTPPVTIFRREG